MTRTLNEHPETIGQVIDEIERIREELFVLQRSLEQLEKVIAPGEAEKNPDTHR